MEYFKIKVLTSRYTELFQGLLDANIRYHVSVENYATKSIAKIFGRMRLNLTVEKLCFRSVSPMNRSPVLKDLPQNELGNVNLYIRSLESIESGWFRNRQRYAQGDSL